MKYKSTRGENNRRCSFEETLFEGLATDGGLYIPESIPAFIVETILSWKGLSFDKLAFQIIREYIAVSEIPDLDLQAILTTSFSLFTHSDITPLVKLPVHSESLANVWILELFHGPTFAFKDVALQVVGNLFEYFLLRRNKNLKPGQKPFKITVLGATSGDTGGAAIHGLKGKDNIECFILHPKDRISSVQYDQMTSCIEMNVHNVAVEGTFDDCQDIVKELFTDLDFKRKYNLAAINSINWARILSQTVYYFYSFLNLMADKAPSFKVADIPKIQYVVPTGNFGDILAGYYAQRMGLPIHKLVIATNENDILHRFLLNGTYEKQDHSERNKLQSNEVKITPSPAMDILVSSNFERFLFYILCGDSTFVNPSPKPQDGADASIQLTDYIKKLKEEGGFTVEQDVLERAREVYASYRVSNMDTLDCISRYYHHGYSTSNEGKMQYLLDPHTAVGVVATESLVKDQLGESVLTICLATASAGKFPEHVLEAINHSKEATTSAQKGFKKVVFEDIASSVLVGLAALPKRCWSIVTGGKKEKGASQVRQILECACVN